MTSENLVECLVMCGTVVRVDTRYLFNRANFGIQNLFSSLITLAGSSARGTHAKCSSD